MSTTKDPGPLDPRDVAAVQGFLRDTMPDLSGAVVVTLDALSHNLAVRSLETELADMGAAVSGVHRPRGTKGPWQLEVRGADAGAVPVHLLPAANLRRLMIQHGQSQSVHGLRAWPELDMSDFDLAAMARAPREDARARASDEIAVRIRGPARTKRVDGARWAARLRVLRTEEGHWPPAAKVIAHARGFRVSVAEFYRSLSYPLLWGFAVDGRPFEGYVCDCREDPGGALRYRWTLMDGKTLTTVGAPDDLAQL